jgi:hypothetical protein
MAQDTLEEQLRKAQIEAAKLREALRKAKAAKRKAEGSSPAFHGSHRGY